MTYKRYTVVIKIYTQKETLTSRHNGTWETGHMNQGRWDLADKSLVRSTDQHNVNSDCDRDRRQVGNNHCSSDCELSRRYQSTYELHYLAYRYRVTNAVSCVSADQL